MTAKAKFPHVVIRASAGTGKTYQLALRFIGLLAAGTRPDEILATTFTRKAAGEILDRVLFWLASAAAGDAEREKLAAAIGTKNLTRENIQFIAQHARMTDYFMVHHVIIPDGTALPFEIKNYGAPVGQGENWKDVSVIKIEVKNAPVLVMGDSDKMNLQDHVTVIGYPMGIAGMVAKSPTGIYERLAYRHNDITAASELAALSLIRPSATCGHLGDVVGDKLIYDAPTAHGGSGGPVFNTQGEVIGINSAYMDGFSGGTLERRRGGGRLRGGHSASPGVSVASDGFAGRVRGVWPDRQREERPVSSTLGHGTCREETRIHRQPQYSFDRTGGLLWL